jgi:hypothetical protein
MAVTRILRVSGACMGLSELGSIGVPVKLVSGRIAVSGMSCWSACRWPNCVCDSGETGVVLDSQESFEFGDGADVGVEGVDAVAIRPGGLNVGEVFVEIGGRRQPLVEIARDSGPKTAWAEVGLGIVGV